MGWVFSLKDLLDLGSRGSIDIALSRLTKKGTVQRIGRGIYNYPEYGKLIKSTLSPDTTKIANALARKFGWSIGPTEAHRLNLYGISDQVPGRVVFESSGKSCIFEIGSSTIEFVKVKNRIQKPINKNLYFKRKYGIDLAQYEELLKRQGFCCAICKRSQKTLGKVLAVDHYHDTKEVRGLLCIRCNTGLGFFKDSKENLNNAIEYLSQTVLF